MVSTSSKKAISKEQAYCLETLGKTKLIKNFYLAGGTALAILLEHIKSVDLDFFSQDLFDNKILLNEIVSFFKSKIVPKLQSKGTLYIQYGDVELSFIHFPYKMIDKKIRSIYNFDFAGLKDIAAMKLSAITGRTTRKVFIDIYFLLKEKFSFEQIVSYYIKKFGQDFYNEVIITKSLMTFETYDEKKKPALLKPFDWQEAKNFILKEAAHYFRSHATKPQ